MLTSVAEHWHLMERGASDFVQPDAPRVGGITQFLRVAALADHKGLAMAPRFAMEIHLHLVRDGAMVVPDRSGLGLTPSDRARAWTTDRIEFSES